MEIRPQDPAGRLVIQRYGGSGFVVGGRPIRGSILVFPTRAVPWPITSLDQFDIAWLGDVLREGGATDLLLLGCGRAVGSIDAASRALLRDLGIVAEAMDTGAACRTYNVLVVEGRRVAAALIAVE